MNRLLQGGLLVLMLQFAAHSQEMRPTITGFVHGKDGTLRPILGVPGSALLGAPVVEHLDRAWAAPNGLWAIGVLEGTATIFRNLDQLNVSPETDERLLKAVDKVVWSSGGKVACLYSSVSGHIQRVLIDKNSVEIEPAIELSSAGVSVTALMVADTGKLAVAIAGKGVYVSRADAALELAVPVNQVPALAFLGGDETLLVADQDSSSILSVDLSRGSFAVQTLAGNCNNILALAISAKQIHVVQTSPQAVRTYGLDGSLQMELALEQQPERIESLQGNAVFLLNRPVNGPAIVLDLREQPAVFFVPGPDA